MLFLIGRIVRFRIGVKIFQWHFRLSTLIQQHFDKLVRLGLEHIGSFVFQWQIGFPSKMQRSLAGECSHINVWIALVEKKINQWHVHIFNCPVQNCFSTLSFLYSSIKNKQTKSEIRKRELYRTATVCMYLSIDIGTSTKKKFNYFQIVSVSR